ncbi:MAG: anhydro-N-acetylmuramic acid kinase [Kangiellaceae bacterium]
MSDNNLYIGLMSGTSIDGTDVALVNFSGTKCKLVASLNYPISAEIKNNLCRLSSAQTKNANSVFENRVELMATMDVIMGHLFTDASSTILNQENLSASDIKAIGSHGQTIRHRPTNKNPFSIQIGDANIIAEKTGITTVADFRRADIAAGGQGAPLAPAFHYAVLRNENENRIILNLGGIANITFLPKDQRQSVIGFDTGPANTLLDAWFKKNQTDSVNDFDRDSNLAKKGVIHEALLNNLLSDPFFQLPYPKSTGREYFSVNWLTTHIEKINTNIKIEDIQRTLLELTIQTIADSIKSLNLINYSLLACGGGMHNHFLLDLLSEQLKVKVQTTNDFNVDGDYLEAMTFAWLAKQRLEGKTGNLPSVTGATKSKVLGAVYSP